MAAAMGQRDGVTAVTATRYPLARRKKGRWGGGTGRSRRGPVACGPSRRHGRHWLAAQLRQLWSALGVLSASVVAPLSSARQCQSPARFLWLEPRGCDRVLRCAE
jgi:hypothetical protein